MKKALFATTAIVAFGVAGLASAAEITLSGDARMGLRYFDIAETPGLAHDPDGVPGSGDEFTSSNTDRSRTVGTSRVRIKFTATGTSDSGLTFGASVRAGDADKGDDEGGNPFLNRVAEDADDEDEINSSHVSTKGEVFVSGSFGTLTYGDTDAAPKKRVSNVDAISLTGLGPRGDASISGIDLNDPEEIYQSFQRGPRIRYDYDYDAFGFSVSTEGELENIALGASYSGDFGSTTVDFGIGYDMEGDTPLLENADGDTLGDTLSLSLGLGYDAFGFKAAYSDNDFVTAWAISLSYTYDLLKVAGYYKDSDFDEAFGGGSSASYGIGASYDLGGGLSVVGGFSSTDFDGDDFDAFSDQTQADFGLAMTF